MFGDEKATGHPPDPAQEGPKAEEFRQESVVHPEKPSDEELERRFGYHAPNQDRAERHEAVNNRTLELAKFVRDVTPPGRAQALALTALEEARMRANQAIAIGE